MPQIDEYALQRAFCIYLDKPGVLAPGVVYWHTPNGGTRNAVEGKRLKDIGTKAGIHDILFLARGRLFGLEFKKPGGPQPPSRQLSPAQQAMHPRLMAAGMVDSAVVDNLADAKAFCSRHMLTINIAQV